MNKTRQKALLALVGFLLVLKFFLAPLIEWQSEQKNRLTLAEKRLTRGVAAIEKAETYEQKLDKVKQKISEIESKLFENQPETVFRLEQQSWLENLLSQFNIRSESISWSPRVSFDGSNGAISEHKLDVTLVGKVDNLVSLQAALELEPKALVLESYNWVIDRHLSKSVGTARGSATLVLYSKSGNKEGAESEN